MSDETSTIRILDADPERVVSVTVGELQELWENGAAFGDSATIHERTCHIIKDFKPSSMTQATSTDMCSECGHVFGRSSRDETLGICYQYYDAPYYCPHCGARVVYE